MGFTKNALFPNTQKQFGEKKFIFWQTNSKYVFPNSKPQQKQIGFFSKTIPNPYSCLHFISKQQIFQNLPIQKKTVKTQKMHGIEKK